MWLIRHFLYIVKKAQLNGMKQRNNKKSSWCSNKLDMGEAERNRQGSRNERRMRGSYQRLARALSVAIAYLIGLATHLMTKEVIYFVTRRQEEYSCGATNMGQPEER